MTRPEFERWYSAEYGKTLSAMHLAGWVSAPCDCYGEEHIAGCQGWQAVCVPPDATPGERARITAGLTTVRRFGEGL